MRPRSSRVRYHAQQNRRPSREYPVPFRADAAPAFSCGSLHYSRADVSADFFVALATTRERECISYMYIYIYICVCSDFSPGNLRRFLPDEYLSTRFYRCLRIGGKEERWKDRTGDENTERCVYIGWKIVVYAEEVWGGIFKGEKFEGIISRLR